MAENSVNATNYVSLQPFLQQVGGHHPFFCLGEDTLCKPIKGEEQLFYETMPESLRSFVPSYHGVVNVHLIPDGHYITFSAIIPGSYRQKPSRNLTNLRVRRSGSIEVDSDMEFDVSDVTSPLNPLALGIHKKAMSKLMLKTDEFPLKCIILENLTRRFNLPCILDLKMGTQLHSDDDPPDMKQKRILGAMVSTSAKLGARISGMQVYIASSNNFLCYDKFYGAKLTPLGFQIALRNFFHDGTRVRTDVLPLLIHRLEGLNSVISQLEFFRFTRTSLLLLYEGRRASFSPHEREVELEEPLADVRIIDFSATFHPAMNGKVLNPGPDNGFLTGVNTIIQVLKAILADPTQPDSDGSLMFWTD